MVVLVNVPVILGLSCITITIFIAIAVTKPWLYFCDMIKIMVISIVIQLALGETSGSPSSSENRDALLVFASYGLSSIPWEAVLSYYLSSLGIQQEEASWLGLVAVVSSAAAGLLAARLTDLLYGHALPCVLALMLASVGALYWLCLLSWGTIPAAKCNARCCFLSCTIL
ncbi:uncharacterized protein LOC119570343 [Penaeus monodon]|uniref:uncharacterized protein LOC119570343 n=1 Tax=Penaeus monodon TaxID=6687 RepID=UPI0018A7A182|nr:uncharacterized protein LOC119570343 [Penaeus monodon]